MRTISGDAAEEWTHSCSTCTRARAYEEHRTTATFLWWQEDTGRGGELQDADLTDSQSLHSHTHKSLESQSFCLHGVIYIYTDAEELLGESTSFTNLLSTSTVQRDSIAETTFPYQ